MKDKQMYFPTIDDEREMKPLWEMAREDRKADLDRREVEGEDVRAEKATEDFFENLGKALTETGGFQGE